MAVADIANQAKVPVIIFNAADSVDHPRLAVFRAREHDDPAIHLAAGAVGGAAGHQDGLYDRQRLCARL